MIRDKLTHKSFVANPGTGDHMDMTILRTRRPEIALFGRSKTVLRSESLISLLFRNFLLIVSHHFPSLVGNDLKGWSLLDKVILPRQKLLLSDSRSKR